MDAAHTKECDLQERVLLVGLARILLLFKESVKTLLDSLEIHMYSKWDLKRTLGSEYEYAILERI